MKVLFRLPIHAITKVPCSRDQSETSMMTRKDEIPDGYPGLDFCFEFSDFGQRDFEIDRIRLRNLEKEPKGEMVINFKEWFKPKDDAEHIIKLLTTNGWVKE